MKREQKGERKIREREEEIVIWERERGERGRVGGVRGREMKDRERERERERDKQVDKREKGRGKE